MAESLTVLVVEDSDIDYARISRILDKTKHDHVRAVNGHDALAMLDDMVFDLILMDVDMPVMDGYAALSRIKSIDSHKGTHVSMLTSRDGAEDRSRSARLGAYRHLTKPANPNELDRLLMDIENEFSA